MMIIEDSLHIKMNSIKQLLNNKEPFYIILNDEFIYNYIMNFLYQKEINWTSGKATISKERDFFWFKNIANGTSLYLSYSKLYRNYRLRVITGYTERIYHNIVYF